MKLTLLALTFITLSLTACGSKKVKPEQAQVDITRPPEIVISGKKAFEVKKDTNETVSYEEWLKTNEAPSAPATSTADAE